MGLSRSASTKGVVATVASMPGGAASEGGRRASASGQTATSA